MVERGPAFEQERPAYEFGYRMAEDSRFAGRDWPHAEQEVRQCWAKENTGRNWQEASPMVIAGWLEARGMG